MQEGISKDVIYINRGVLPFIFLFFLTTPVYYRRPLLKETKIKILKSES